MPSDNASEDLYTTNNYFYKTQRQKIIKRVTECYLRDDLGYGSWYDASSGKRRTLETAESLIALCETTATTEILICDTNVVLRNMDVLERLVTHSSENEKNDAVQNKNKRVLLVFPETTLIECQSNSRVMYDRAADLIRSSGAIYFSDIHHAGVANSGGKATGQSTSINDRNDAKIRATAEYFARDLGDVTTVVLLTDDAASRKLCTSVTSFSVSAYISEHHPDLSDWVAQQQQKQSTSYLASKSKPLFSAHLDAAELSKGIASGKYHRSVFRRSDEDTAVATVRVGSQRVAVQILSQADHNRAVDGDVVAIALHPVERWITDEHQAQKQAPSKSVPTGIPNATAEPTTSQVTNVPDVVAMDDALNYRPTGKVVGIVRRNFGNHCGSIYDHGASSHQEVAAAYEREDPDGSALCVFFPVNGNKVPPIIIRTMQRERLLGQRIVVAMDSWPIDSAYPLGHYVKAIGKAGEKDVETAVILQQHDIPHDPFSAAVLACLPKTDFEIELTSDRTDLRHLPVLSIDPPGCKDIDDALHCIELPNGNYQVGVHIADVTHYVKPGTPIDLEAASRSTSTYLVNKRLDMLPGLLTTDLCSLKGLVDRYAFSILWEVTPQAEIINVDFCKTLIHSIAALTYQQAQTLIDQPDDSEDIQAGAVKRLASLARKFRKRRIDAGALTLASPEVKFVLDSESLNPTDVQAYALLEANSVVEEFMLLANVTVAKKILRHYPTLSILRRHPAPSRGMFESLISKAAVRGLSIDIDDSKKLADSLDAAQVESDPYINKLLRILSTRCMSPAQYFCSGEYQSPEWHHYGLAAPVYTHFTSPIRRYADVCVHRLLAAAIEVAPLPAHLSSKSYLHDLSANMNRRHRAAQIAGRDSVQLHTLIFFSGEGAKEETAYVLDVDTSESRVPSLTVMVPRYGIEGKVRLDVSVDESGLERFPTQHKVHYKDEGGLVKWSFQVFDKVKVRLWVRELQDHQRELVVELAEPLTLMVLEENPRKRPTDAQVDSLKKLKS